MAQLHRFEFEGCRFAWRVEGEGPPLVMIQGVGAHGTAYNPITEILQRQYQCMTFDNRGIGESQPAGKAITVNQLARDTLALIDNAGWSSVHLVGHSLGGLISLEIALIAKARVRSLTLLNTFANGADANRMTPRLLWIGLRLRFGWLRMRRNAFMELVLTPGQERSEKLLKKMERVFGHDIGDLPEISDAQLAAMGNHNVTDRLGELAGIPTLIVSGEKDLIARPSSGRAIAAGIPGATYVEIAGGSHAFPILEPERCADLILEHLRAVDANTPNANRV
jgi:pimeloyl-ACP methyl ester carboxylesterase